MLANLKLADWVNTRNAIQNYSKVISSIRMNLSPVENHWFHLSLKLNSTGITTLAIPYKNDLRSFQLTLDLTDAKLFIDLDIGERISLPLQGLSQLDLFHRIQEHLSILGFEINLENVEFSKEKEQITIAQLNTYRDMLIFSDNSLKRFKSTFNEESGPVQLWPDHFDLALLWFSGNLIKGKEDKAAEESKEQMNFGFSTGDSSIDDAYYYITSYPQKMDFKDLKLENGAFHYSADFNALILPYSSLINNDRPDEILQSFLMDSFKRIKKSFIR